MKPIIVKGELDLSSELPAVVEFWAQWCGPCRVLGPLFNEIAEEFDGKALFYKVNTDDNPELVKKYKILGIPTTLLIKDGEVKDQVVGAVTKGKLQQMLNDGI